MSSKTLHWKMARPAIAWSLCILFDYDWVESRMLLSSDLLWRTQLYLRNGLIQHVSIQHAFWITVFFWFSCQPWAAREYSEKSLKAHSPLCCCRLISSRNSSLITENIVASLSIRFGQLLRPALKNISFYFEVIWLRIYACDTAILMGAHNHHRRLKNDPRKKWIDDHIVGRLK